MWVRQLCCDSLISALVWREISIYTATEGPKVVNKEVKEFLMETEVLITLCLTDGFTENAKKVIVRRNFLSGKRSVLEINGQTVEKKDFEGELERLYGVLKHRNLPSDKSSLTTLDMMTIALQTRLEH